MSKRSLFENVANRVGKVDGEKLWIDKRGTGTDGKWAF